MTQPQGGEDAVSNPATSVVEPTEQSPAVSRGWSPTSRPGTAQGPTGAPPLSFQEPEQAPSGGGTTVITSRKVGSSDPSGAAARDGRASWLTTGLVGLLAAVLAVGTVLLLLRYEDARATDAARAQGGLASRDSARTLLSYDYKSIDKDFVAGQALTTGQFAKEYRDSTSALKPVVLAANGVVRADVIESSVVEASPQEVTALLFVNSTATTDKQTGGQGPNIVQNRVQMHLVKVNGRWLVDKLQAL